MLWNKKYRVFRAKNIKLVWFLEYIITTCLAGFLFEYTDLFFIGFVYMGYVIYFYDKVKAFLK